MLEDGSGTPAMLYTDPEIALVAGNHSLAPTFVLDIDGIAILSALAIGYEDGVSTRCGTFSNRRMVSGRLRP